MRRRALLVLAGIAALVASQEIARPLRQRATGLSAPAWATLLGPVRPLVAALVRLRFESVRLRGGSLGQLEDAWSALALAPGRPDDFVHFGWHFVFDAPRLASSSAERDACVRAGFDLLLAGRRVHPRSARLAAALALALDQLARHAPERLRGFELAPGETARSHALALFEEALALAASDDPDLELLRMQVALCAEGVAADPETPAPARDHARALLGR